MDFLFFVIIAITPIQSCGTRLHGRKSLSKVWRKTNCEAEKQTLTNDKGCVRYEWYRGQEPNTYILIERWIDRDAAMTHLRGAYGRPDV